MSKLKRILLLIPFILSSCSFRGDLPLIKNGDLLYSANDDFLNNVRLVEKIETIDTLIKADEKFIFYISSSKCHSCTSFNPILNETIINYEMEVYYIDVFEKPNIYLTLCQMYPSYFLTIVATPHIYLVEGRNGSIDIENRFYETKILFENSLKKHFYETNLYNFRDINNLKSFINDNKELLVIYYDKTNSDAIDFYQEEVFPIINQTKKNIAIIDYAMMDENSQNETSALYHINDSSSLSFYLYNEGKLNKSLTYNLDKIEDIKIMLKEYS